MATKFGMKKHKQHNVFYTIIAVILLCTVFFGALSYLYTDAKEKEYENLHVQTKQIKDDIILQLTSDRENLETMANFAAKLYKDGEDYDLLFESFKPIGMIENIGILNSDNTFSTKAGTSDTNGALSFEEEKNKRAYISGKIGDITNKDYVLIRSAVPIIVDGKIVAVLYGAIKPEKLAKRYIDLVQELDAQLFIYEKDSGDILIDTIQDELENISALEDRKYKKGYSYETFIKTDKGFTEFESKYKNENLLLHYSAIEEFGWMIALGRYDSQVFVGTHKTSQLLLVSFFVLVAIMALYLLLIMKNEKSLNAVTASASEIRKELLETIDGKENIADALQIFCEFACARTTIFFDTSGGSYHYITPTFDEIELEEKERNYFRAELIRYALDYHKLNGKTVNVLCVKPNKHMLRTNPSFYKFMKEKTMEEVSFSATINNRNHVIILAAINSKHGDRARMLAEKISACFSMALYNKTHLDNTELVATTDSLTGVGNRVLYNKDILDFDEEKPLNFSCIYIDVNELHLCNNKYGHAAGDEMLIYIANTLSEVFYGQKVYRMGGDEFLVFCKNSNQGEVEKGINLVKEQLKLREYHIASGISYRSQNTNTKEMVSEAEKRMYEAKAQYYQNKELKTNSINSGEEYVQLKTGIVEIDTLLSMLKENYNGIYRVSLDSDKAKRILMPAYLGYNEDEEHYSKLFTKYVEESVNPDYHRSVLSFLNYDAIKKQLTENKLPKIRYKKNNNEVVALSVYKIGSSITDTLWVFSKE